MAVDEKQLMMIQAKVDAGVKLNKEEKQILKENSAEERAKKGKMSFGQRLQAACKSEFSALMGDNDEDIYPIRDWISTGNLLLNAQISSNVNKGIPTGRVIQLAGESAVGKTYLALEILKNAQAMGYFGVLYDSEMANNDKAALKSRGIDTNNLLYVPIDTVENLKTSVLNIIEEADKDDKVIIIIDSIGNLSTNKELEDSMDGSGTKDMTRAAQLKALFRTCTIKAGVKNIPIIAINHVYACGSEKNNVSMADGTVKSLKDIKIGDTVKTLIGSKEIENIFSYEDTQLYQIELENGEVLEYTDKHKFLVKTEHGFIWKELIDIQENDYILSI